MASERDDEVEEDLQQPHESIWPLLTDVHCHPTDDPRPWKNIHALSEKLKDVKIGRVCAMSTSTKDQHLVSELADKIPHKIIPAFGYHPWFVHLISVETHEDPKQHYRKLFKNAKDIDELEDLIPGLPAPTPIDDIMETLRSNLQKYPSALLGEVGIDKAFRLPANPKGWTREPDKDESNGHTLALRERPLTNLYTPMEHQLDIIKRQIVLAIEYKRSVSLHSVRAGGATMTLLDDLRRSFPSPEDSMNKKERRIYKQNRRKENGVDHSGEADSSSSRSSFADINVDLHSCTISASMINQIQRKHSNVYVSFSTAINSRQKDLHDQLQACDPKRLLIESDFHSAEEIGIRCWQMLQIATDVLGDQLLGGSYPGEDRYIRAAKVIDENWQRFIGQQN